MQYLHSSSDEQVLLLGILEHDSQIGHRQWGSPVIGTTSTVG
jgi:hypothetical protein